MPPDAGADARVRSGVGVAGAPRLRAAAREAVRSLGRLAGAELGVFRQHGPRPLAPAWGGPAIGSASAADLPAVAVVIPSLDQRPYLPHALDSVLGQADPARGVRLMAGVADGGSRDGSADYLRGRAGELAWFASGPDGGQAPAINRAFAGVLEAAGDAHGPDDLMAWLNADDVMAPHAARVAAEAFAADPDLDVVYGHRLLIDEAGSLIGRWTLPPHREGAYAWSCYIPQETLFWRRRVWERVGGLDESFRFAMDWDLIVRFIGCGAGFRRLPVPMGCFRVHDAQKSTAIKESQGRPEFEVIRRRALDAGVPALACRARAWAFRGEAFAGAWANRIRRMGILSP